MENNYSENEDEFMFDGDDLKLSQAGRAAGAHDPIYLTRASRNPYSASVKGKDVATSSATFTLRSAHQALSHHDDKCWHTLHYGPGHQPPSVALRILSWRYVIAKSPPSGLSL
ncbi:hypothetical protein V6N13_037652 [Hibiscus sabdariffa]